MKKIAATLCPLVVVLFCCFGAKASEVDKKVKDVGYYNKIFGHIHQNPSRYSTSLTNIACGHPLRIFEIKSGDQSQSVFNNDWKYISAGPYEGYVMKKFISSQRPDCFQDKYPRFFEQLGLSITDMHFWGRLYDHFLIEKTDIQ